MPCDSRYMKATTKEVELSRVACLLDELDGKSIDKGNWGGYHPAVYNNPKVDGDAMVSELCSRLQAVDVTKFSLEMQMWWRDHQAADKERISHELLRKKQGEERDAAMAKLTDYELSLFGLVRKSTATESE